MKDQYFINYQRIQLKANTPTTPEIPIYIPVTFLLTVLIAIGFAFKILSFSNINQKKYFVILGLMIWLGIQGINSYNSYYLDTVGSLPPPFTFIGFVPAFIFIATLFLTVNGRSFIDSLPLLSLSLLSIVRIPVEIVLYSLYLEQLIPKPMTFHGLNFDILAGITAPFIAYFGFRKSIISKPFLFLWNIISLILLLIIILLSILSFPSEIQQYAFDQPNVGMLHFTFFWLPSFIVPFVFFSHLVAIRRLKLK